MLDAKLYASAVVCVIYFSFKKILAVGYDFLLIHLNILYVTCNLLNS